MGSLGNVLPCTARVSPHGVRLRGPYVLLNPVLEPSANDANGTTIL